MLEAVLVTNGPGELYSWAQPLVRELRRARPEVKVSICLVPDQFVSGKEAEVARTFGVDTVSTHREFLTFMATGQLPAGLGAERGFVLSLGGNVQMALRLARRLGYPAYRYSFVPTWHRDLRRLFMPDEATLRRAQRRGAPRNRLELAGNLVADAVLQSPPAEVPGRPHVLLLAASRDAFSLLLIPFMLALAERLGARFPDASFVWPVSQLLAPETVAAGVAGTQKDYLGGVAGVREGDTVITPRGVRVQLVSDTQRHAHMRAADLAITIPGTNTLELGVAGVPSVVVLPLNKPEVIPLEGVGHWLGLLPLIGTPLKRAAVRLFVEGLNAPVSLPNRLSGEDLMLEVAGILTAEKVAECAAGLLGNEAELARRRRRLLATMPRPGAAQRLVSAVFADLE